MLSNIGSRKNSASRVYTYIYMGKQDIYIALKSKLLLRPRKYRVLDNFWIDSFLLFLTKLGEISVKLSRPFFSAGNSNERRRALGRKI